MSITLLTAVTVAALSFTLPTAVSTLLNAIVPVVYGFIKNPDWSKTANRVLALVLSLLVTILVLVIYYLSVGFDRSSATEWVQAIIYGVVASQAAYSLGLKDVSDAVTTSLHTTTASDPKHSA